MIDAHADNGKRLGGCTGRGFMPGQSGNPRGRPPGPSLTRLLREALDRDDGALAEMVVQSIIKGAQRGDFRFLKMILDRVDGPVPTRAVEPPAAHEVAVELTDDQVLRLALMVGSDGA